MKFTIWTDGGFSYNHKIGSWAFIAISETGVEVKRFALVDHHKQTSQVAEMFAFKNALEFFVNELCGGDVKRTSRLCLDINSDSQYCVNSFNDWMHGWARADWCVDKENLDLWRPIYDMKKMLGAAKANWVKGHAGIEMNERVDQLTQIPLQVYRS